MPPPRSRTRILDTSAHPEEQERSDRLFFSPEMSSPSKSREMDLMKLMMSDYKVEMVNDGIQEFFAEFRGPNEGIYQGGVWKVRVELADAYPYKSSSIGSINKMYHPNVDEMYRSHLHTGEDALRSIRIDASPLRAASASSPASFHSTAATSRLHRLRTIFDIDTGTTFEEKPWKYPGADISDFFNFGLDEEKWKDYCKQVVSGSPGSTTIVVHNAN